METENQAGFFFKSHLDFLIFLKATFKKIKAYL